MQSTVLSLPGEACAELGNVMFVGSDLILRAVHLQAGSHNASYFVILLQVIFPLENESCFHLHAGYLK